MRERQIGPIRFIPGGNKGKYPNSHSIYIQGSGILIDAGADRKRLENLKETEGINAVWLSHWHEDHIRHLDMFGDVPIYISQEDADPLMDTDKILDYYGVEDKFRPYWQDFLKGQLKLQPRIPDGYLHPGQVFDLDEISIEILSTPGHTPGHLSFFFKDTGVLFMGDYDLGKFGPWYGDKEASIEDTIASVKYLRSLPAKTWITSHETGFFEENPGDLWDTYLNVIQQREDKLLSFLNKPHTLKEIVNASIVYLKPREPKAFFEYGERAHMEKHLRLLQKRGVIGYNKNLYYIKK
jgi:glyoxylase-like metal-dependent hydrolase (beta-lactamase superfamily II)